MTVTVIIPALNEANDIGGCIDALGAQTYPLDQLEVVVVDGDSSDGTAAVAGEAAARFPFKSFAVLSNPARRTSVSLNVGLDHAHGDEIVRVDARSRIQPDYIERIVALFAARPDVGVVGGAQCAIARSDGIVDRGIARGQHNRWTSGWSTYRRARRSGPADTVWMGAFRTAELRQLGGWDAHTALNEDFELNERHRKAGHTVWFDADLRSTYVPRASLRLLAKQHFYFGRVKGMWWARGRRPLPRQVACVLVPPMMTVACLLATRRSGGSRVLLAATIAGAALDAGGSRHLPAGPMVRLAALASIVVYSLSWWFGVVAGICGQVLGLRHRHG